MEGRGVYVDDRVVGDSGGLLGGLRLQPDFRRHGFRPRHQRVEVGRVARVSGVGHLLEQPLHVLARVQAVRLGRDRDRLHAGRGLGAARRVAEQEVLAADDERLDVALGQIVVERRPAVVQRARGVRSVLVRIAKLVSWLADARQRLVHPFARPAELVEYDRAAARKLFHERLV